jgi:hypothetical protein
LLLVVFLLPKCSISLLFCACSACFVLVVLVLSHTETAARPATSYENVSTPRGSPHHPFTVLKPPFALSVFSLRFLYIAFFQRDDRTHYIHRVGLSF